MSRTTAAQRGFLSPQRKARHAEHIIVLDAVASGSIASPSSSASGAACAVRARVASLLPLTGIGWGVLSLAPHPMYRQGAWHTA